jgi:hypothetical protein
VSDLIEKTPDEIIDALIQHTIENADDRTWYNILKTGVPGYENDDLKDVVEDYFSLFCDSTQTLQVFDPANKLRYTVTSKGGEPTVSSEFIYEPFSS